MRRAVQSDFDQPHFTESSAAQLIADQPARRDIASADVFGEAEAGAVVL
jgi:hypothetical protein